MINTVIKCCRSPNCNLRETAFIALSYVYGNIYQHLTPEHERDLYINKVNILIKQHCFDNIIEVRDACAFALRVYIENNNCSDVDASCKSFYIKLISSLNNDTVLQNEVYPQLTKEIFECITSKQDFGFMRPVELYEVKDGAVHVIKELAGMKGMWKEFEINAMKYEDLLMIVIDYLCKRYNFGLQNLNKKTIWECLGVLMLKIDKYDVEFYLDYVIDILIKELDAYDLVNELKEILTTYIELKDLNIYVFDPNTSTLRNYAQNWCIIDELLNEDIKESIYNAYNDIHGNDFVINNKAFKLPQTISEISFKIESLYMPIVKNGMVFGTMVILCTPMILFDMNGNTMWAVMHGTIPNSAPICGYGIVFCARVGLMCGGWRKP
jgi:hypothetical protein